MKISAELVLASRNAATNDVLYTFVLTYPRPILPHILTHRVFSRNTSSDRAIPSKKLRKIVRDEPYIPIYIGQNQKGMVAGQELRGWRRKAVVQIIRLFRYPVLLQTWILDKLGVHKQIVNRYSDPYIWVRQVVTATDWQNFLLLRNHKDAEPHVRELARQVAREIRSARAWFGFGGGESWEGNPPYQTLEVGQWHLPFITEDEKVLSLTEQKYLSAARAARTSYTVSERAVSNWDDDLKITQRLINERHWSPTEHQAKAANNFRYYGNFKSFIQFRKEMRGEDGGDRATELYKQASEVAG